MSVFTFYAWVCIAGGIGIAVTRLAGGDFLDDAWALLLGAGKGYLFFIVTMLAILLPYSLWYQVFPIEPRCRTGRCGQRKYRGIEPEDIPAPMSHLQVKDQGRWLKRCACGDYYLHDEPRGRFWFVQPDGTPVPFRKTGRFGRWLPDDGGAADAAPAS